MKIGLLRWLCPVLLVAPAAFADSSFDLKVAADKSNIAVHVESTGGSAEGKNMHVKLVDKGGKKFTIIGEKGPIGILKSAASWKIEDSSGNKLFVLKREEENRWKLKDGQENEIYKIKGEPYGVKVEDKSGQVILRVYKQGSLSSLKDASDKTVMSTVSGISPLAFSCFGYDALPPEDRAALAIAVSAAGY